MVTIVPEEFRAFHKAAANATDPELNPLVRSASRWANGFVLSPEEAAEVDDFDQADYDQTVKDAALLVARYLFTANLSNSSRGLDVLRRSEGYVSDPEVIEKIVRETVGDYYSGGNANVAYVGPAPWRGPR